MLIPSSIIDKINSSQSFLGHIHLGPDPDTIGSSLALMLALEQLGKLSTVFCEDPIPTYAMFLPGVEEIKTKALREILSSTSHQVYLSLDTAKWPLATHSEPLPQIDAPIINLDHHPDNVIKTKFKHINSDASSTAEIIHGLLKQLKVDITPQIATCLLFGLMGDTGSFQNFNTNPLSLRLAADLIDQGGDYIACLTNLSRSYPITDLKAWAVFLNNLKISDDKTFVYVAINYETWTSLPASASLTLFANQIISRVAGTHFGAILIEKRPGVTSGSIRSRLPDFDVAKIAHHISGGGHPASAGFKILKPLAAAETDFLNAIALTDKS